MYIYVFVITKSLLDKCLCKTNQNMIKIFLFEWHAVSYKKYSSFFLGFCLVDFVGHERA